MFWGNPNILYQAPIAKCRWCPCRLWLGFGLGRNWWVKGLPWHRFPTANHTHNGYRLKKSKAKNADFVCLVHPPPKFNSSPLKNHGWKTTFLLERAIFKGYVKLPGSIGFTKHTSKPMKKFTMFAWHIHPSFDIFDTSRWTLGDETTGLRSPFAVISHGYFHSCWVFGTICWSILRSPRNPQFFDD